MAQCDGIKRDGGRCEVVVSGSQTYCYHHDPGQAEKRKRVATRGGRSKGPNKELADVKRLISGLIAGVLKGTTNRGDAAVCGQLLNTQLRAVAVEMKVKEVDELEAKMAELEEIIQRQGEGSGRVS
jgi:hypothetical protein